MSTFQALLETQVGKAVTAKFAEVAKLAPAAMKAEIAKGGPLGIYFIEVVATVTDQLKQEAA